MLNDIQIQELLKRLPDQQLAPMAQGSSPNVNPQDVMMEMNRRAQLRKANEMKPSGIAGLSKGGMAKKKYAEGGLASLKALPINSAYLSKEEQLLKDRADRMKAAEMGLSLEEYRARMKTSPEAQRAIDMIPKDTTAQMLADQKRIPPMPKTPMPSPESLPPAFAAATAGSNAGIGALSPTKAVAQPETPVQKPAAPVLPEGMAQTALGKLPPEQQAEIAQKQKDLGDYFVKEMAIRKEGLGSMPDMKADKEQAFYKALVSFGASLATTGVYAVAGKEGMDTFAKSIQASEDNMKQFKAKSAELGLMALANDLKLKNLPEEEQKRMIEEARKGVTYILGTKKSEADVSKTQADTNKTMLESSEIPADSKSRRRLQEAQADYYESGGRGGAEKELDLVKLRKQAVEELKTDPAFIKAQGNTALQEQMVQRRIAAITGGSVAEAPSSARRYKVDLQGNVISP